jgi:uncharacterized protein (TIGR00255 family)
MTGYGRRQINRDGREMTLEIRTVNHRFLDLSFRVPKRCAFLEDVLRREIADTLTRGHADVSLTYVNTREDAREIRVDTALAAQYCAAFRKLSEKTGSENDAKVSLYASLPDVLTEDEREEDQTVLSQLAVDTAHEVLGDVLSMREREGEALSKDLTTHLNALEALVRQIEALAPLVPAAYRERLTARLKEAEISQVDPQRLAQEVALWADKCAIDEELSRLDSHIAQMRRMIVAPGEIGKKLDFLTQEMNREVNTIGSKACDIRITNCVVEAKSEIEKLREQVQNVE